MRKSSSNKLKKPSKPVGKVKRPRGLSASKKASNVSQTASGNASNGSRTPGKNTRVPRERLRSDPRLNQLLEKAIQLKNRDDFEGAVRLLRIAVKDFPDCAPAYGLLGGIYLSSLNRPDLALRYCKKATKLSPKSEMASLSVFHSLWDLDRQYDALEEMKRFQTISHSRDYDEILAELREKGYCGRPRKTQP